MQTEPLTRKERERLARRDEILNAARDVFSERGFKLATLDEIAERAEFGKGTIYNYFRNKEELFVSVIERGIQRFQAFVENTVEASASPRQKIEMYIDAAFEFFEQHRQLFSVLVLERYNLVHTLDGEMFSRFCQEESRLHEYLAGILAEGIRKKAFRRGDPVKLAQAVFGLLHVAYVYAVREPERWKLRQDSGFLKKFILDGISN